MKNYLWVLGTVLTVVVISANVGCTYNNEEELYANDVCDTVGVTYRATVEPILSSNCYNCHRQANAPSFGNGIVLDNYAGVNVWIASGRLLCDIKGEAGCTLMPKGGPKMSDCNIAKIEAWINAGALDN